MNQGTDQDRPAPSALALRCRGLRVRFGRTDALDGLDLDLAPGDALGIVGRNCAGTTTHFRCLIGAERADAGSI